MARDKIAEKLNEFLSLHNPITEESQVVYLMVELRKMLDHDRDHGETASFTLLRFYCDWMLHTEKDRITSVMHSVMDEIYEDIKKQIENSVSSGAKSPVARFIYMDGLRAEMQKYLELSYINLAIVGDGWIPFVQYLVKVLEDQPIKNPNKDIELFSFLPASPGCVYGKIQFKQPIGGLDHYNFGNAY